MPSAPMPTPLDLAFDVTVRELPHHPGPTLIALRFEATSAALGTWAVPPSATEVFDPLIGFVAADPWDVLGCAGPLRSLPGRFGSRPVSRTVTLVDRAGRSSTTVLASPAEVGSDAVSPDVLAADPTADLLRRSFGLETRPPTTSVAAWIDRVWLQQVAHVVTCTDRRLGWRDLATQHPLATAGDTPEDLRCATITCGTSVPWGQLRQRWLGPEHRAHPPDGVLVAEADWFDDGAFSRWHLHQLQSPTVALSDLELLLPTELVEQVIETLAVSAW